MSGQLVDVGSADPNYVMLNEMGLRIRKLRLFFCLEVIFLGLPYFLMRESEAYFLAIEGVWVVILFLVLVLAPLIYFLRENVSPRIVFFDNYIELPRYLLGVRKISNESICSLEEMVFRGKKLGVFVGLRDGARIDYDPKTFLTAMDYEKFKGHINRILDQNKGSLNGKMLAIKSLTFEQNIILATVLGFWLAVFFYLRANQSIDFYSALESGAIMPGVVTFAEIYRVPASYFLHLNFMHISMNILSLALFGQFLLRVVDLYRFICILLLSAFLASLFTLALSPYDAIIGASGGIMGVFGAYCCLRLLRYLPGSISSSSNAWILFFIAVQVALEYFVEGIDSYTHAGGFVTGFVYMWFCIKNEKEHSVFESSVYEKVAACGLALSYLGGLLLFFSKLYAAV